jgi:hypothetical protein
MSLLSQKKAKGKAFLNSKKKKKKSPTLQLLSICPEELKVRTKTNVHSSSIHNSQDG